MKYEIGGPIQILQLKPDGSINWIKNKPSKFKWAKIQDFVKSYFDQKINIYFVSEDGKRFFEEQARILVNIK